MATADGTTVHKHFRLNPSKLKLAQTLLEASTETETVERALDLAISEYERNKVTEEANHQFLTSGAVIRDIYGKLAE